VNVGLCHSDLHYIDGTHTTDLPEVLGHEAAGVVESVGELVTSVKVGDHVVTSLTMSCGRCRYCTSGRMSLCSERAGLRRRPRPALATRDGTPVGVMGGIGAFAELTVVHENAVTRIPRDLPMRIGSLFGCAVLTGVGAVTRAARVPVGATVAVVGCGGIGLAVIQGALVSGASRIVAIDRSPAKLDAARDFGATDVLASDEGTAGRLQELVPGGVDFSFEAVGRAETAELAFSMLAPGGTCTVLGMVPDETPIRIPASSLYFDERRLQGAFIGSSRFTTDVPDLIALYAQGRLRLDAIVSHTFGLDQINEGFEVLAGGEALRVVLEMPT
jgi:S-(hydroxymethyl)glutathione dehydrogenase/alcohol dehydrogenase